MDSEVRRALKLEIADTAWVLGHWYMASIPNSRALADFSALAGMGQEAFGLVSGMFEQLDTDTDFESRSADEIASAPFLDAAPTSWADLVVGSLFAEILLRADASLLLGDGSETAEDAELAGLIRRVVEVSGFHLDYELGWLDVVRRAEPDAVRECLSRRGEPALAWAAARHPQALDLFADVTMRVPDVEIPVAPTGADRATQRAAQAIPPGLHTFLTRKPVSLAHVAEAG
ncbi:MAG: hypothetical protein GEV10_28730 [Streptosporangiales bacterium]|nr:hypothetical protein [Streptosporangiales bacterium]